MDPGDQKTYNLADWLDEKTRRHRRTLTFFFQRLTRGWDDSDLWSLDQTLSKLILPRLKLFRDNLHGYPVGMTMEEWEQKLDEMIFAHEFLAGEQRWGTYSSDLWARVQNGLDLFAKHYCSLWD
jgi:hypothetical protein